MVGSTVRNCFDDSSIYYDCVVCRGEIYYGGCKLRESSPQIMEPQGKRLTISISCSLKIMEICIHTIKIRRWVGDLRLNRGRVGLCAGFRKAWFRGCRL